MNGSSSIRFPVLASLNAVNVLGAASFSAATFVENQGFLEFALGFYFLGIAVGGCVVSFALWKGRRWSYISLIVYSLAMAPVHFLFEYEMHGKFLSSSLLLFFVIYFFVAGVIVYYESWPHPFEQPYPVR